MGGLFSPPGFAAYAATKHALEAIAEAMQGELKPFGIQVQTINPGAYLTGFNEAMAENAFRWLDDAVNFTKRTAVRDMVDSLIGNPEGRRDPYDMIAKMVEVIPASEGKFRNVHPQSVEEFLRTHQAEMFDRRI
jgi:NAD(P)-dependent dehydrogenase (short-subunit alcohol dehydrogenase family)